jgi:hypothetical protein
MVEKTIFFTFLVIFAFSCKSTSDFPTENNLAKDYDINTSSILVRLDPLNNMVLVDNKNFIHRYTNQTEKAFTYNDNTLGKISHVDVTDPLKIVIYKKDYGVAIFLDNTLSEIDRINLYENGFTEIPCIASSNDGNLWIYDYTDYRLKKITQDGRVILESMSMLDFGLQNIKPFHMQERYGKLILQDEDLGIFLFDNLGQYIQPFPFKLQNEVQFDGSKICFLDGNDFTCYNVERYQEVSVPIGEHKKTGLKNVKAGDKNFYYIYTDGIDIIPKRS